MKRCLFVIVILATTVAAMVMFDWLNAREWVMDGLGGLQYGVEVLSDWGDSLQGKAEKASAVMEQAGVAVEQTQRAAEAAGATVEKINE